MRRFFLAALLAAVPALCDEAADKLAVMRTILALNELPMRQSIFTADASIDPAFHSLWEGRRMQTCVMPGRQPERPTVTISHEPWGEAAIGLPPVRFEITNPRIVTEAVRFVTEDVAIAEGASVYDGEKGRERKRLWFVLRLDGADWRIAAVLVAGANPRRLE